VKSKDVIEALTSNKEDKKRVENAIACLSKTVQHGHATITTCSLHVCGKEEQTSSLANSQLIPAPTTSDIWTEEQFMYLCRQLICRTEIQRIFSEM